MNSAKAETALPQPQLTLFRSVCIIVGVIVGSGIFESPPSVAANVTGGWGLSPSAWLLLAWILGGAVSLLGALCYAELAATYPHEGGDYVYLNRAFSPAWGFLFGWARLAVIQGGSIGAIAYVFGDYATRLLPLGAHSATLYAALGVTVLTAINIAGVREGALTQNILTVAKVLGLGLVVLVAFLFTPSPAAGGEAARSSGGGFGLAMIFILWTYGGWNEIAYVAAEVKDARRNILRSLVLGIAAVTIIYVLVNGAFLRSLGFEGLKSSKAAAADVLQIGMGPLAARAVAALVVISALGALNGFILTSPRVYYAMGREHRLFGLLGRWSPRFGTPVAALILQWAIVIALIVAFGSRQGFGAMVKFTSAVFWFFLFTTGISLFVLREKDRDIERPYRVPIYPLVPILFCLSSAYMLNASASYAPLETLLSVLVLLAGLPLYFFSSRERGGRAAA